MNFYIKSLGDYLQYYHPIEVKDSDGVAYQRKQASDVFDFDAYVSSFKEDLTKYHFIKHFSRTQAFCTMIEETYRLTYQQKMVKVQKEALKSSKNPETSPSKGGSVGEGIDILGQQPVNSKLIYFIKSVKSAQKVPFHALQKIQEKHINEQLKGKRNPIKYSLNEYRDKYSQNLQQHCKDIGINTKLLLTMQHEQDTESQHSLLQSINPDLIMDTVMPYKTLRSKKVNLPKPKSVKHRKLKMLTNFNLDQFTTVNSYLQNQDKFENLQRQRSSTFKSGSKPQLIRSSTSKGSNGISATSLERQQQLGMKNVKLQRKHSEAVGDLDRLDFSSTMGLTSVNPIDDSEFYSHKSPNVLLMKKNEFPNMDELPFEKEEEELEGLKIPDSNQIRPAPGSMKNKMVNNLIRHKSEGHTKSSTNNNLKSKCKHKRKKSKQFLTRKFTSNIIPTEELCTSEMPNSQTPRLSDMKHPQTNINLIQSHHSDEASMTIDPIIKKSNQLINTKILGDPDSDYFYESYGGCKELIVDVQIENIDEDEGTEVKKKAKLSKGGKSIEQLNKGVDISASEEGKCVQKDLFDQLDELDDESDDDAGRKLASSSLIHSMAPIETQESELSDISKVSLNQTRESHTPKYSQCQIAKRLELLSLQQNQIKYHSNRKQTIKPIELSKVVEQGYKRYPLTLRKVQSQQPQPETSSCNVTMNRSPSYMQETFGRHTSRIDMSTIQPLPLNIEGDYEGLVKEENVDTQVLTTEESVPRKKQAKRLTKKGQRKSKQGLHIVKDSFNCFKQSSKLNQHIKQSYPKRANYDKKIKEYPIHKIRYKKSGRVVSMNKSQKAQVRHNKSTNPASMYKVKRSNITLDDLSYDHPPKDAHSFNEYISSTPMMKNMKHITTNQRNPPYFSRNQSGMFKKKGKLANSSSATHLPGSHHGLGSNFGEKCISPISSKANLDKHNQSQFIKHSDSQRSLMSEIAKLGCKSSMSRDQNDFLPKMYKINGNDNISIISSVQSGDSSSEPDHTPLYRKERFKAKSEMVPTPQDRKKKPARIFALEQALKNATKAEESYLGAHVEPDSRIEIRTSKAAVNSRHNSQLDKPKYTNDRGDRGLYRKRSNKIVPVFDKTIESQVPGMHTQQLDLSSLQTHQEDLLHDGDENLTYEEVKETNKDSLKPQPTISNRNSNLSFYPKKKNSKTSARQFYLKGKENLKFEHKKAMQGQALTEIQEQPKVMEDSYAKNLRKQRPYYPSGRGQCTAQMQYSKSQIEKVQNTDWDFIDQPTEESPFKDDNQSTDSAVTQNMPRQIARSKY